MLSGCKELVWAADDLCGGTGGNGQIISIGNKEFTMKRNDNGSSRIVHLTDKATIETSSGLASLSDLKTGDRVTLVGGPNRDGSFSADYVVVCAATQDNVLGQTAPLITNREDLNSMKVREAINIAIVFLVVCIWFSIVTYFRLNKGKSYTYLLFFTIFFIYLYKVLDYTLIQFQSLLLLKHFASNLMLSGVPTGKTMNFIPLATLKMEDIKTSLLNILMMLPFGFGLPFITNLRFKKIVLTGLFLSMIIEFLQFGTGFLANTTFRIADVNDLIFNTLGVAIGYISFVGFIHFCRYTSENWKIRSSPILQYISERPQIDKNKF